MSVYAYTHTCSSHRAKHAAVFLSIVWDRCWSASLERVLVGYNCSVCKEPKASYKQKTSSPALKETEHLDLHCLFFSELTDKPKASRQVYIVVIRAWQRSLLDFIPGSGDVPKVSKHTSDKPPLHSQLASICPANVPTALCLDDPCAPGSRHFVLNLSHTQRSYNAFGSKAKLDQSLVFCNCFKTANQGLRTAAFSIH